MPHALFFQRRFLPMWVGFALGVFCDNALKQALLIGLTYGIITLPDGYFILPFVNESSDFLPYAGALFAIAMILLSPIAGQYADKYETRFLFYYTKLAEIGIMLLASVGFLTMNGSLLVLSLLLMGAQSAFFSPVRYSAMPKLLAPGELLRGNAFFSGGLFVFNSLAYVFGGLLISKQNGSSIIAIVLLLSSLVGWLVIRRVPMAPPDAPDLKIDWNLPIQYKRLLGYVLAEPAIIRPLLGSAFFYFIVTAVTVALPEYTKSTLGAGGDVSTSFMVMITLGALVGAGISACVAQGKTGLHFATAAMAGAVVVSLLLYLISNYVSHNKTDAIVSLETFYTTSIGWSIAVLFGLCAASMAMFIVPLQAAVQRRLAKRRRARVIAAGNVLNALAAFIGSLLVVCITTPAVPPQYAFIGFAILQAIVVTYMLYRKRTTPSGLYDEMLRDLGTP